MKEILTQQDYDEFIRQEKNKKDLMDIKENIKADRKERLALLKQAGYNTNKFYAKFVSREHIPAYNKPDIDINQVMEYLENYHNIDNLKDILYKTIKILVPDKKQYFTVKKFLSGKLDNNQ